MSPSAGPVSPSAGPPPAADTAYGVYVHVPFCVHRCDYCAFATWTDRAHLMGAYAAGCVREVTRAGLDPATSVFFGGGTPSLLPGELLGEILASIPRTGDAEVTVECNPETVTEPLLAAYSKAGVTRLCFGVQPMVPTVLAALGRRHDPGAVRRAVDLAGEAGYGASYSVDLIYGGVGETVGEWRRSLEEVLALDPAPMHISAYGLTVEPGTPLAGDPARHPDPDDQADKYLLADRILADAGLEWYEISNWSRPGAECRHNQLYWRQGEYRGIGASAHSHQVRADGTGRRWWNVRTPERYLRLVDSGADPVAAEDIVERASRRLEARHLALRTREGVEVAALEDDPLLDGLVRRSGDRLVLTVQGRLLANEVALRLVT